MGSTIEGRVLDGSGSTTSRGLSGVCISNGEAITKTDRRGCYSIQVDACHRFLIATVPEGYRACGSFYRILSDMSREDRVDFEFIPASEGLSKDFRLAQISDTHVSHEEDGPKSWTREVMPGDLEAIVNQDNPHLIAATGDLTKRGGQPQLKAYLEIIRTSRVHVISVFGGHDGNEERYSGESGATFTRNYESILGPVYYSFDRAGRHFVVYAKEDYFFSEEDAKRKDRWFWQDLSLHKEASIVVLMHTPPSKGFLDQLARYSVKLVLYGHWHSSKVFRYKDITVAATQPFLYGGIDTEPRGYRLIRFHEGGFDMEVRPLAMQDPVRTEYGVPSLPTSQGRLGILWERSLPSPLHRSSPVTFQDSILVSLRDEDNGKKGGVCCLDTRSGEVHWRIRTGASVKNSVAIGLGERGRLGMCAFASVTGKLHCVDISSGLLKWHRNLPGFPDRWIYTSPIVAGGRVFAGAKSGYGAYDTEDGKEIWYSEIEGNDAWSCYASPRPYGDMVIVLISRRGLIALDRGDGSICWETELPVEYHYSSPVVCGDLLVTGGDRRKLALLRADTGEIVWHGGDLEGKYPTGLTVDDDRIYAATSDGIMQCNDLSSGERTWTFSSGEDLLDMTPYERGTRSILARPVIPGGDVFVCGCDGWVYVLDKITGVERGRTYFGSPVTAAPCVVEEGVCIGTYDGHLYYFSSQA